MKIIGWMIEAAGILLHKESRTFFLASRGLFNNLSDKEYINKLWKRIMDYPLDLDNPKTFNEKLQWLKLFNRNQKYTTMVDKYDVG